MSGAELPPTSAFADDDGSAPAGLAAALALPEAKQRLEAVVTALRTERVLVPVVARLDEMQQGKDPDEIVGEKLAHTAMVTVALPDGRAGLPVFSSMASMARWRTDARPVPTQGRRAALAAGAEADGVLVVDPGSAGVTQVGRPATAALALDTEWMPAVDNPEVAREVNKVLTAVPGVEHVRVKAGTQTEVLLVVYLQPHRAGGSDPATAATLQACQQALATSQLLVDHVDSVAISPAITD